MRPLIRFRETTIVLQFGKFLPFSQVGQNDDDDGGKVYHQYSGVGYITVSSRTQDRNTPSARTHRTHGRTR